MRSHISMQSLLLPEGRKSVLLYCSYDTFVYS